MSGGRRGVEEESFILQQNLKVCFVDFNPIKRIKLSPLFRLLESLK